MEPQHSASLLIDKIVSWLTHPKIMMIMEGRVMRLRMAVDGLEKTGVPLIGFNGTTYMAAEKADDCGMYYFVPKIMNWLQLSLPAATNFFFLTMIIGSFACGATALAILYKTSPRRWILVGSWLMLGLLTFFFWDTYVALACAVNVIPVFWWLKDKSYGVTIFLAVLTGLLFGFFNSVRSHAGNAVFLFIAFTTLLNQELPILRRAGFLAAMMAGLLLYSVPFHRMVEQRNTYLSTLTQGQEQTVAGHVFWHQIYLGLGFLQNDFGMYYADKSAEERVKQLSPQTFKWSQEYEDILKRDVTAFVKTNPGFVVKTLLVKTLILLLYFLVFVNMGLLPLFKGALSWRECLPFAAAIAFHSLYGLLIIPHPKYVLGFLSFSLLLGIFAYGKRTRYPQNMA